MIAGAVVALAILGAAYWFFTQSKGENSLPALPAKDMQDNPSALRGSDFSVTGKVKEKLHHSDKHGSLIALEVTADGEVYRFPIQIPSSVDGPNISVEQSYIFNGTVTSKQRFVVSSYDDK